MPDPRDPGGVRHSLVSLPATAVAAALAGATSFAAIAEWIAGVQTDTGQTVAGPSARREQVAVDGNGVRPVARRLSSRAACSPIQRRQPPHCVSIICLSAVVTGSSYFSETCAKRTL